MRYNQLPINPAAGVALTCTEGCQGPTTYSASRGDYFSPHPDDIITCECGAKMELVQVSERRRKVSFRAAERRL